jgi:hypothetical protein
LGFASLHGERGSRNANLKFNVSGIAENGKIKFPEENLKFNLKNGMELPMFDGKLNFKLHI